ncbi:MAG: DDE-type integrase/transposase/recombinase [Rectinemataceae bacterium]|nr:DDE-type integrase/transposase/recombinase [Rectinemataceae bacterium]
MAISMAKTIKEERLRWVLPVAERRTSVTEIIEVFPYGKRTLERWLAAYRHGGESTLEPKSTRPKTCPRETPIRIKEAVIALRKKKKRCALKLHWRLAKQGIVLHERTIGKIIKAEGLTRKYRTKKVKYKYLKAILKPGALVEIDVKHVPGVIAGKRYFQYTAIDVASRWRHLAIYEEETTQSALMFLKEVSRRFPYPILAVKTDNHATFTNRYNGTYKRSDFTPTHQHAFDRFCAEGGMIHYLIDPGHPAQNGTVERSHRSDQETLYDKATFRSFKDLQKKLVCWNIEYNNLEHCGLSGKTPNEALAEYKN